jgi:hypothetical protein
MLTAAVLFGVDGISETTATFYGSVFELIRQYINCPTAITSASQPPTGIVWLSFSQSNYSQVIVPFSDVLVHIEIWFIDSFLFHRIYPFMRPDCQIAWKPSG